MKDWKLVGDKLWRNNSEFNPKLIRVSPVHSGKWHVKVSEGSLETEKISKFFDTKNEAIEWAENYRKKH